MVPKHVCPNVQENKYIMAYARLLHQIPEQLRRLYRNFEALRKKQIQNEWSMKFNEICLQEGILPNFTRIYIYTIYIYIYI